MLTKVKNVNSFGELKFSLYLCGGKNNKQRKNLPKYLGRFFKCSFYTLESLWLSVCH